MKTELNRMLKIDILATQKVMYLEITQDMIADTLGVDVKLIKEAKILPKEINSSAQHQWQSINKKKR